jgi:hypothetical protein
MHKTHHKKVSKIQHQSICVVAAVIWTVSRTEIIELKQNVTLVEDLYNQL